MSGRSGRTPLSVSIADAVAIRGLDGEPWEHERSRTERPELDDVASAAKADLASLALHDEHMNLDVVETAEVSSSEPSGYDARRRAGAWPPRRPPAARPSPHRSPSPSRPPRRRCRADSPTGGATDRRAGARDGDPGRRRLGRAIPSGRAEHASSSSRSKREPGAQSPEPEAQAPAERRTAARSDGQPSTATRRGDKGGDSATRAPARSDLDRRATPPRRPARARPSRMTTSTIRRWAA